MKYEHDMTNVNVRMWEILVPTVRQDGRPIHTRFHRVWDKKVRELTGGLTICPPIKGHWVSPTTNEVFVERMIPVKIATTLEVIEQIAFMSLEYYEQETVLYYEVSSAVRFVRKVEDEG